MGIFDSLNIYLSQKQTILVECHAGVHLIISVSVAAWNLYGYL